MASKPKPTDDKNNIPKNLSHGSMATVQDEQFWATIDKQDALSPNETPATTPRTAQSYNPKSSSNISSLIETASNATRPITPTISPLNNEQQTNSKSYNTEPEKIASESQNTAAINVKMEADSTLNTTVATNEANGQLTLCDICGCCFKKKAINNKAH